MSSSNTLYPPYLDNIIPGFYGDTLFIPLTMNPAVGLGDFETFDVQFKSIVKNKVELILTDIKKSNFINNQLTIALSDKKISNGFHKIQIRYKDNKNKITSAWSNAAIIKKINKPTITIQGLEEKQVVEYPRTFTGKYQIKGDSSEKIYSSKFTIYRKSSGKVAKDSDWIIHNVNEDQLSYSSTETYTFNMDLSPNLIYLIQWTVKTTNGILVSSPKYQIKQTNGLLSPIAKQVKIEPVLNRDEGTVELQLVPSSEYYGARALDSEEVVVVSRSSRQDKYTLWEILDEIKIKDLNTVIFKDYSIAYGETYKYSIQTIQDSYYSARIISTPVTAYFDDMFLWDGRRQLKIQYNPKVSTYKPTLLEQKIDTIGSKYPFFFRNGNVNYKEFALSGLLSYLTDRDYNFITEKEYQDYYDDNSEIRFYEMQDTQLTDLNFSKEKYFKDIALDWLTNGEPKVFKSPTEGNSLVRLMNVSLTPTDTVSRMLYTFNSSAYEIDSCDISTLRDYKIINDFSALQEKKLYQNTYEIAAGKKLTKNLKNSVISDIVFTNRSSGTLLIKINGESAVELARNQSLSKTNVNITSFEVSHKSSSKFTVEISMVYYRITPKNLASSKTTQRIFGSFPVDNNLNIVKPFGDMPKKSYSLVSLKLKARPEERIINVSADQPLSVLSDGKLNTYYELNGENNVFLGGAVLYLDSNNNKCITYYKNIGSFDVKWIKYKSSAFNTPKQTYIYSSDFQELNQIIGNVEFNYEDLEEIYLGPGVDFKATYVINDWS